MHVHVHVYVKGLVHSHMSHLYIVVIAFTKLCELQAGSMGTPSVTELSGQETSDQRVNGESGHWPQKAMKAADNSVFVSLAAVRSDVRHQ